MSIAGPKEKKRKLCFVSPNAYPILDSSFGGGEGGAEAQLCTIGKELSRRGYDVHFIVGDYGQGDRLYLDGVTVHRATFRYLGGSNIYVLPDWWRIFRLLTEIRADYHFIKVPQHLLFLMGMYCKMFGAKLVFIGQKDSDLDEPSYREREGSIGWWMYRKGIRLADGIVAQTDFQKKAFRDIFGKTANVIRNVLTLEMDNGFEKQDYVLWVGSSADDKQPLLVPELASVLPDIRFRMIMSSSGNNPNEAYILEQLDDLPNLEYLGSVPFAEISVHYKQARLFISTSRCEGFPNTFLQAWQYRTPVVSLSVDPDHVIERMQLGRVSGKIDKMIQNIRNLYNDDALCVEMGENAYRYAYKYHSLELAARGYLELIDGLETER